MKIEVEKVGVQGTDRHVIGGNLLRTPAKLGALTAGRHRDASKGPAPLAQWAGGGRFEELDLFQTLQKVVSHPKTLKFRRASSPGQTGPGWADHTKTGIPEAKDLQYAVK